jgi:asparagine synthase (glutamine-hydrolysing)
MPGLAGITKGVGTTVLMHPVIQRMQDSITYNSSYIKDPIFEDESICATRSSVGVLQREKQPYVSGDVYVWFDGELYNRQTQNSCTEETDPELVCTHYTQFGSWNFLKNYDGLFSIVIYDKKQRKIHLISDRYGFRHLYWAGLQDKFIWGSELKLFFEIPGFSPEFNVDALNEFVIIGTVIGDHTFVKNIELLPAATVVTYDIVNKMIKRDRYWWWDEISGDERSSLTDEEIRELGRLFTQGVERRIRHNERIGITLSGGLDSRAILAAVPDSYKPLYAITCGEEGSADVVLAKRAAKVKGAIHRIITIDKRNWFFPRLDGIWITDGHTSMLTMGAMNTDRPAKQYFDIFLTGAGGDGVFGGKPLIELDKAAALIEKTYPLLSDNKQVTDIYLNYMLELGSPHIVYIDRYMKNLTMYGLRLGIADGLEPRLPFMDNDLQEQLFKIKVSERKHASMYERMLLLCFPEYYKKIPRQSTGIPIGPPTFSKKIRYRYMKLKRSITLRSSKLGIKVNSGKKDFTDYENWMREKDISTFIENLLKNSKSIYSDYLLGDKAILYFQRHLAGENHSAILARFITVEIWLQQVVNGIYRRSFS